MVMILHKFVFVYFLFFLLLFSYETINVNANEDKYLIYIDPGHGGMDGGCSFGDLIEKNVNLKIGLTLKDVLESKGYEVKPIKKYFCDIWNCSHYNFVHLRFYYFRELGGFHKSIRHATKRNRGPWRV